MLLLGLSACATTPAVETPTANAPATPAEPVYQLSDVMGAGPGALDSLLGSPALTRREGAGEFRRYSLNLCSLLVILYPDETGAPKASQVDAAALVAGEETPDVEQCLAAG